MLPNYIIIQIKPTSIVHKVIIRTSHWTEIGLKRQKYFTSLWGWVARIEIDTERLQYIIIIIIIIVIIIIVIIIIIINVIIINLLKWYDALTYSTQIYTIQCC